MADLRRICLDGGNTLNDALECLDETGVGIVLAVDEDRRLRCTITDGDLRRAVLAGLDVDLTIEEWLRWRERQGDLKKPITASFGSSTIDVLRLMQEHSVRHIPLLGEGGEVLDLAQLGELVGGAGESLLSAVVMAGGKGTRLRPLTLDVPKPMLPVGDRPILEHIVEQLRGAGVQRVNISTHYKSETIVKHFGNGDEFGVSIDYLREDRPLGTAGALSLLEPQSGPLLVINGDILTKVDFRAMMAFHREHDAAMTVGIRKYELHVPYGVMETEGPYLKALVEKPRHTFFINAGIYIVEPRAQTHIPTGEHFNMTDLMESLIAAGDAVVTFPILEYWLDIGRPEDYERAVEETLPRVAEA